MRLLKLIIFLSVTFAMESCIENAGTWKNGQINAGKREDLHKINDEALGYLKANDPKDLKSLLCKELKDDNHTDRLVELISNRLTDDKYSLLDEYYVINNYKDQDTIPAKGNEINGYRLSYPGTTREMYIAFFIPKSSKNKYMLNIIYAKYNYGWKISNMNLGPYTINGKTAPELFKLAKENYNHKYLIDALNNTALAFTCARPSDIWQYPDEAELHDFYVKLLNEVNRQYKFPFVLNAVSTKPMIIRVYNQTNSDGAYPMVYYLTRIKLNDMLALKKENEQIKKVIGKIMPGIDKNKEYIFYSAFNHRPTGNATVDHYDMTEKLP
jgi:hypothetical protein